MSVEDNVDSSLDTILTEVGVFGVSEYISYTLLFIANVVAASFVHNYIISANTLEYRCKVPECDVNGNNRDIEYDQPWLSFAIPSSGGHFKDCVRYAPTNKSLSNEFNECSADSFDTSRQIKCSEYIYASDERNVQTEFGIHCSDTYKLALVGTANNAGRFLFMPLTGLISDKFGRLRVIVIGMFCSSVFGIIKSFSINYIMYTVLEFLESASGTSTYTASCVLGVEWVNSKHRVLGTSIVFMSYPMGAALLGLVAMNIHDFRYIIRVLYTPGLLAIFYYWLIPESVRWLLISGRVKRAKETLKEIASTNGNQLSQSSIDLMELKYSPHVIAKNNSVDAENHSVLHSLRCIIKSKTLCLRFMVGCYQWITCCFSYYGLNLISTHIPGENRYISFILVVSAEIPGIIFALPLMKRMRRRRLLFIFFFISAILTVITPWIPKEHSTFVLVSFMLAKASISCALNVMYIFTSELWPTNLRMTILNSSSMIGRVGAMLAPFVAILITSYAKLPALLFGGTAFSGAFCAVFLPETYGKKLPDTIQEAKELN